MMRQSRPIEAPGLGGLGSYRERDRDRIARPWMEGVDDADVVRLSQVAVPVREGTAGCLAVSGRAVTPVATV